MGYGYTSHHAEWLARYAYTENGVRPDSFEVLVYDDEADELGPTDDVGDIDSEPSGLARDQLTWGDVVLNTDVSYTTAQTVGATFDFAGITGEVDSVGAVWEADLADDDGPTPHLMTRQPLDDRYDLAEYTDETTIGVAFQLWPYY